ncbi:MAG: ExbD/TolR family protein [Alphaproteobacteria bacterium]|jgi:biopolymer transport protein ExbD
MARRIPSQRRRADPTITLINVVFLMLMFFLVAGTIAAPPPADLRLVQLAQADPLVPPEVLSMTTDGQVIWKGAPADPAAYVAALPPEAQGIARVMPDRDAPAVALITLARALRSAGAAEVRIVTERSTP